jgi:hypothetical protein
LDVLPLPSQQPPSPPPPHSVPIWLSLVLRLTPSASLPPPPQR